jgi:nitrite reductase/ring-hydroxylating ferredoxin subunit
MLWPNSAMRLITNLVRERKDSDLGRRQVLLSGTAGLTMVALQACTVDQVPNFVPPTSGPNGPGPNGSDGGSPPGDEGGVFPGQDSSSNPGQTESGSPQMDTGGGGSDTSAPPPDTGGGVDTGPPPPVCNQNANTLVVPLSAHPELANTGGNTLLSDNRYSDPSCQQNSFYIVTTGPGQYAAFSASCTHSCATVLPQGSSFWCPRHGATFDFNTGAATGSPANGPLSPIPVCTDGTNLYLQLA